MPDLGAVVRHNEAKFVLLVPEQISQEPLATENTCKKINYSYIIASLTSNLKFLFIKIRELELEPQFARAVRHNKAKFV